MKSVFKTMIAAIGISLMVINCHAQNTTAGWKTYTSSRYAFSFPYPATWVIGADSDNVVSGAVASRTISITDPASKTLLLVNYNVANGAKIYDFYVKNFDPSTNKKIKVAGVDAIQLTTIDKTSGRGRVLNKKDQAREINIEFLDKKRTGAFELKFVSPLNSGLPAQIKKFNSLVSGFKFLN